MIYLLFVGVEYNSDNVEAERIVESIILEVGIGRRCHTAFAQFVHSILGISPQKRGTCLNFNKDYLVRLFGYNIHLKVTKFPVPIQDLQTFLFEKSCSHIFTLTTKNIM